MCKNPGILVSLEIHFLVSRLRGCEQINGEDSPAEPTAAPGTDGDVSHCQRGAAHLSPAGAVLGAGAAPLNWRGQWCWDGNMAGLLMGHGHPIPGQESRHPPPAWQSRAGRPTEEEDALGLPTVRRGLRGSWAPRACAGGSPAPHVSIPMSGQPRAIN